VSRNSPRRRPRAFGPLSFGLAALALLVGLFLLGRAKRPPALPVDSDHQALAENLACAACHGAGAVRPLLPVHPPKDDCRYCHRPAPGSPH